MAMKIVFKKINVTFKIQYGMNGTKYGTDIKQKVICTIRVFTIITNKR